MDEYLQNPYIIIRYYLYIYTLFIHRPSCIYYFHIIYLFVIFIHKFIIIKYDQTYIYEHNRINNNYEHNHFNKFHINPISKRINLQ